MTPNRIVAFLTPLVFAPAAGAIAAWVAEQGLSVDQSALEEVFIAGALIALAPAVQWLNGWQKHEAREAEAAAMADRLDALAARRLPAGGDLTPEELELEPDFGVDGFDDELDGEELDALEDPLLDGEPAGTGR